MTDTMTPEQRSRCMAAVKSKNTKPEILVRKYLFARGLRFRLNSKLFGHPDIVFPKYRVAVFVDGCFWHGHEGCKLYRLPKTNADFWRQKIALNIARDYRTNVELRLLGWRVIRVWECDLRNPSSRDNILNGIYLDITSQKSASTQSQYIAAEPSAPYGTKEHG